MTVRIPLAARIRNALYQQTAGDSRCWVQLHELERALDLRIDATVQAAVRAAADEGWIRTTGGREILGIAMTEEGIRLCRGAKSYRGMRPSRRKT